MRAKSDELLVDSDLIRPDGTLGEESLLVNCDLEAAEDVSDPGLELVAVADGVLLRDRLDLIRVGADLLDLGLNVCLKLCTLGLTHCGIACDGLVDYRHKLCPSGVHILLGICRAKNIGVESDESGNGNVIPDLKVGGKSAKRIEVSARKLGVDRELACSTRLVLHGDKYVDLGSCHGVLFDI